MNRCNDCKYYDCDFEFNGIDEEEVDYCEKGIRGGYCFGHDEACEEFEHYIAEPYYEEDTECDTCEYFEKCLQNNEVIDCTTVYDTRRHYIFGRSGCYKQNIPLETENCVGCENLAECMREAMIKAESIKTEKGDVTFECRKGFFKVTM